MFTFIVFVGDGWLTLLAAHLPYLRLLGLRGCDKKCDKYIAKLVASLPELSVINHKGDIVGASSKELHEIIYYLRLHWRDLPLYRWGFDVFDVLNINRWKISIF
jgi:hypothetical protein